MPPRYLMKDVIVCIPGITGSVLRKDGKDVWNISGGAFLNALTSLGKSIGQLRLEDDPSDVDDVDGITAPSVIRDVHLIPGLWKIDGYTKLVDRIQATFDVTLGKNLHEFPYDWRRDNRVAARQLGRRIEGWLTEWRRSSGASDAKAILVGHSMGGLIARYYIECLGGWRDTRTLVTFGTPYGGSMYALGTLVNGKRIKFFDLTDVARSMTALYQLLPLYECYDGGDGDFVRVTEAEIPQLDAAKAEAAARFHREIRDAVDSNFKDDAYAANRYEIRPIVGIEQPTAQSAVRDGQKVRLLRRRGDEDVGGDGTVPRPSATPREFERLENAIYSPERHASLQNDDDVLFQLTGILTGAGFDPTRWRSAVPKVPLSLDVEDEFAPSQPILVRAQPKGDPAGALVAIVEDAATGEERGRRRLVEGDDGWYGAELGPLPEGLYRVTAIGGTVEPVTDLVTVFADA
jgi:pimeloyl-ACP methyl ester carboxylesterase